MRNVVIGAGGVGSWLIPKLARLESQITIMDGDEFEVKNLDRQLFPESKIGWNKAMALCDLYSNARESRCQCSFVPEYFSCGAIPVTRDDLLWCCADNHACRREVLDACDFYGCRAIIAANEYTDAEAYWYSQDMAHSPNDPRVIYPDILTDRSGDPLGPPGCVEAAKTNRQLVIANSMASELAMWLYYFWVHEAPKMDEELREFFPVHHRMNSMTMRTIKWGDRLKEQTPVTATIDCSYQIQATA
jgi:hypothetical protein